MSFFKLIPIIGIRSFASMYPEEIAALIFADPIDFTKKKGDGDLPYLEIGLTQHQIDSIFGKPYDDFIEKLYEEILDFYVDTHAEHIVTLYFLIHLMWV